MSIWRRANIAYPQSENTNQLHRQSFSLEARSTREVSEYAAIVCMMHHSHSRNATHADTIVDTNTTTIACLHTFCFRTPHDPPTTLSSHCTLLLTHTTPAPTSMLSSHCSVSINPLLLTSTVSATQSSFNHSPDLYGLSSSGAKSAKQWLTSLW